MAPARSRRLRRRAGLAPDGHGEQEWFSALLDSIEHFMGEMLQSAEISEVSLCGGRISGAEGAAGEAGEDGGMITGPDASGRAGSSARGEAGGTASRAGMVMLFMDAGTSMPWFDMKPAHSLSQSEPLPSESIMSNPLREILGLTA